MKSETQAFGLFEMMQNHTCYLAYELVLPLVMVRSSKLKKLSVNDIVLTGFDTLEFLLIEGDTIRAHLVLKYIDDKYRIEIIDLAQEKCLSSESKRHANIKFSLGTVQIKTLEVGQGIDVAQLDMENINLVLENKNIAKCSLVCVDNEIAVKIDKVLE